MLRTYSVIIAVFMVSCLIVSFCFVSQTLSRSEGTLTAIQVYLMNHFRLFLFCCTCLREQYHSETVTAYQLAVTQPLPSVLCFNIPGCCCCPFDSSAAFPGRISDALQLCFILELVFLLTCSFSHLLTSRKQFMSAFYPGFIIAKGN